MSGAAYDQEGIRSLSVSRCLANAIIPTFIFFIQQKNKMEMETFQLEGHAEEDHYHDF